MAGSTQSQSASQSQPVSNVEDEVRSVIVKRFDGIKNKDEKAVTGLLDESYSKFDDWSPYQRQERAEALKNEFSAFKVLSNYTYELKDFKDTVLGEAALATFTIHYQANMRNQQFDVTSRVTAVLKKQDSSWKLVHEHLSRFPTERQPDQQRQFGRRRFPF
jgi:ketosteroid isomerase-like protein